LHTRRACGADFAQLSGEDHTVISFMAAGGHGCISVTANVAPRAMHELCVAAMAGHVAEAVAINDKLIPLHNRLFVEPNPVPVKWALQQMGRMQGGIRLPLVPLGAASHEWLHSALRESGVLN
jgi:4-hydroxy-tetrahydrodipicolinate synthase